MLRWNGRYIIFEGYDDSGHIHPGPKKAFESTFLQYMTRKLPSIAIQCGVTHLGVPYLVDLTSRNIPVLLLDTTERAFTSSAYDARRGAVTQLARESNAFPLISPAQFDKIVDFDADGLLSAEALEAFLSVAMSMTERKMHRLQQQRVVDKLDAAKLAFFHRVLTVGSAIGVSSHSMELYQKIRELEQLERNNKGTAQQSSAVPPDLTQRVMEFIFKRMASKQIECQLARVSDWISQGHQPQQRWMLADAMQYKHQLEEFQRGNYSSGCGEDLNGSEWLAYYDILTSKNTYSGSVFDTEAINSILNRVAKIDRLPSSNSLQALRILQDAYDHMEVR